MYCFSEICYICLKNCQNNSVNLNLCESDNVKIYDKVKYCIPEIFEDVSLNKKFPENICNNCHLFIKQVYKFKQLSIGNSEILKNYMSKLSNYKAENTKSTLVIQMNSNKRITPINQTNLKIKEENTEIMSSSEDQNGTSKLSISLTQWNTFETKFTCRCIKEYSHYTEDTTHLCEICEEDLQDFRLSKIKVNNTEKRHNENSEEIINSSSQENENELGFNESLLSKVQENRVNKQKNDFRSISFSPNLDDSCNSGEKSSLIQENRRFKCTLCDKSYNKRFNLIKHFKIHKEGTIFICNTCPFKSIDKLEFEEHSLRHENRPKSLENHANEANISLRSEISLSCNSCNKIFIHKSNLAVHLMTQCNKNGYKYLQESSQKENLIEHKQTHTANIGKVKYECTECDRSFSYLKNFHRHQNRHNSEKNYLCSICNYKFFKLKVLEKHIFNKHSSKNKKSASKQLTNVEHLEQNTDKKHILKTKYCKFCKKHFNKSKDLKKHELTHSNKLYNCSICKQNFTNKHAKREHMKTHKRHSNFKCEICSKSYMNKYNLNRHRFIHI